MMHQKMNRALGRVSVGIVCGLMTACAGGDTPARNSALEGFLSSEFGSGTVGQSGNGGSGNGGSGNGGSGNSGSGNNGGSSSGSGGSQSGSGGSNAETGGTGGDDEPSMGGSGGGGDCDGFMILQSSCGSSSACHGAGSGATPFAASESDAADWVDEPAEAGCGSTGTPIFDPADPSGSLVILKLSSSPPCGITMPLGGTPLTPDQIDCVEEFISGL